MNNLLLFYINKAKFQVNYFSININRNQQNPFAINRIIIDRIWFCLLFFCHKEIVIRQIRCPSLTEEFLFSCKEKFYLFLFCLNTFTRPESYRIKCKISKYPRSSLILFCKTICVVMKITVGHSLEFSPPSSQMKLEIKRNRNCAQPNIKETNSSMNKEILLQKNLFKY